MGIIKISKIIFIKNKKSGSSFLIDKILLSLTESIKQHYPTVEAIQVGLQEIGPLAEYCSRFKERESLFVACGGDGTVTYVAESIFKSNVKNYLSVIPFGTGNDFSRDIGTHEIRQNVALLTECFLGENNKKALFKVPLWKFNEKYFLNYLSIGFDAKVAYCFDYYRDKLPSFFNRPFFNKCMYIAAGVRCAFSSLPKDAVELIYKGQRNSLKKLKLLIISNINSYAGGFSLVQSNPKEEDKLMLLKLPNLISYIRLLSRKMGWADSKAEWLSEFSIKVNKSCYAQLDGEPFEMGVGTYEIKMQDKVLVLGWKNEI